MIKHILHTLLLLNAHTDCCIYCLFTLYLLKILCFSSIQTELCRRKNTIYQYMHVRLYAHACIILQQQQTRTDKTIPILTVSNRY